MQKKDGNDYDLLEPETELPLLTADCDRPTVGVHDEMWLKKSKESLISIHMEHNRSRRCDSIHSDSSISTCSQQPQCRICHLPASRGNTLLSPCRCAGTLRFVHKSCLVHWLEVSAKKVVSSPHCELCGYNYRTHRCLSIRTAQMPRCSRQDRILHLLFIAMLLTMLCSAFVSILYLCQDNNARARTLLSRQDITVISCSLLFFVAFFVAVFTQYRAETSLCCLFARCWLINRHWRVKDFDSISDKYPKSIDVAQSAGAV